MLLALIFANPSILFRVSMFRGDIAKAAAKNQAKKWLPITLGPPHPHSRVFSAPASVRRDPQPATARLEVPGPSNAKKRSNARFSFNILSEEVDRLRAAVPEYLADAVRESTKKTYSSFWERYKRFCNQNSLPLNDAESVSIFLIALAEKTENRKSSLLAKHALKYFLKLELPSRKSATDTYLVGRISAAISKKFGKPVKKTEGLKSETVKKLLSKLLSSGSFKDERTAVFILLQFIFMARFEEMARLSKSNVSISSEGNIQIIFPSAKNYEKWDARTSWAQGTTGGEIEPIKIVQGYLAKLSVKVNWLFPNFRKGRKGKINFCDKPLSYDNMLKLFKEALISIGEKPRGLHGTRSGAISEAANSARKPEREVTARHVRWKNPEMLDLYHELSLDNKLAPSRALGLYD